MKRIITVTVIILFLLSAAGFLSCAKKEKAEEYVYPTDTYDTPPTATVDPFDGKVNGLALMENTVYYATDAGVFRYDEEMGSGVPILDVPVDFVEKHRGAVIAVSLAERCVYRIENNATEEIPLALDARIKPDDVFSFAVCNDSFVFLCRDTEKISGGPLALFMIDRKTGDLRTAPVATTILKAFSYKGNRIFLFNSGNTSDDCWFSVYDTEAEREEDRIPVHQTAVSDAEYCPYNDSLMIYTRDAFTKKMSLIRLDLTERIARTLISFDNASDPNKKGLVATETNIVCCGMRDSGELRYYDADREYPSVTVVVYGYPQPALEFVMSTFKDRHGIDVNLLQIGYDEVEKLNAKLLAQDDDIDLYCTFGLTPAYYILRNAFCDLRQFDTLADNLSRCALMIEAAASYNGAVFGVPTEPSLGLIDTAAEGNLYNNSFYQYMAMQIDLTKKEYRDENGEALKTLYQHYLAYPEDNGPTPPWGDFRMFWASYMIMNPSSHHKEEAALFLNDLLSLHLGDFDGQAASFPLMQLVTKYPENADYEDVYIQWKFTDMNVFNMIGDGLDALKPGEMTDEAAKDLARRIKMVIME
ncbi:MAG: ABC transporter substrate-binding protein [Clostridiales bacterium]|nr:ABC transporter substrate-binding protein [Clostridiales bacterium]